MVSGIRPLAACLVGATLLVAGLSTSQAQSIPNPKMPKVTAKPEIIAFKPWREVEQTEESIEYVEEFPSPIVTASANNNIVPLHIFLPAGAEGPVPVVLVLHYWGAADLRAERALAQELNRNNIAAAVMTLPYHISRTPPNKRSGELAIEPDPQSLVATMTQAVFDTRRSLDFLDTRPEFIHDKFGLAGTSLGAVVAALTYAVDERIAHVTFVLGGVNLANIVWNSSILVRQRDVMRRRGVTLEKLSAIVKPIEPLEYLPTRPTTDAFVIGGLYDTIIPRQSTDELIASLDHPKVLWLDTGHYGGIFVQRRLMREVAKYFSATFNGGGFVVPKKLYAPTIRVGVKLDSGNGLDLGVGLDLLKFDHRGNDFSTLFVTPRGLQIFLGHQIHDGISIGVVGSVHRVGVGVFWSAVL